MRALGRLCVAVAGKPMNAFLDDFGIINLLSRRRSMTSRSESQLKMVLTLKKVGCADQRGDQQ
jgi:hypothetical protein